MIKIQFNMHAPWQGPVKVIPYTPRLSMQYRVKDRGRIYKTPSYPPLSQQFQLTANYYLIKHIANAKLARKTSTTQ